jgi:hypothetical protein
VSAQVASTSELVSFQPTARSASLAGTTGRLFDALTPLHGLKAQDAVILQRAAAALRFIRVAYHHNHNEREMLRTALTDLNTTDALVVQTAASFAADCAFVDEWDAWERLSREARLRALWFAGTLRLAESLDAVCAGGVTAIHAAWTEELLHLEVDAAVLSSDDIDRVLSRVAALEALTGRHVLFTSASSRRGAA